MITQGHDNAETAAIRSMPEYSKTQAALNAQLAKVPYGSGISACRLFASGIQPPHKRVFVPDPYADGQREIKGCILSRCADASGRITPGNRGKQHMMIRYVNGLTRKVVTRATAVLLAGFLAGTVVAPQLHGQPAADTPGQIRKGRLAQPLSAESVSQAGSIVLWTSSGVWTPSA